MSKPSLYQRFVDLISGQTVGGEKTFTNIIYQESPVGTDAMLYATSMGGEDGDVQVRFGVGSGGWNRGVFDYYQDKWMVHYDKDGNLVLDGGTPIGDESTPIYLARGVPTACSGGTVPAGAIIMWAGSSIPAGYLLCNGASVSRSDYPDLADALGETGTTFSLPDYRDRVPQGAGTVSPNVGVDPGLPELAGTFVTRQDMMLSGEPIALIYLSGRDGLPYLFSNRVELDGEEAIPHATTEEWGSVNNHCYYFRASHLNSIYSMSDSVQPSARTAHFLIKC